MTIALCDDDAPFRAQTARSLANVLENKGIRADVENFASAEMLLQAREKGASFDLYLLDIVMPGMNGVTLARKIREDQPKTPILFFTTSADYAVEAFALGAAHYVIKPFTREQFAEALDRALELVPKATSGVMLNAPWGSVKVPFGDLLYSETSDHYQLVRLADGKEFITRMAGQELWDKLEPSGQFVRAGLKFIINLAHVTGVGKGGITLTGERTIEIPRRAMPEIKAAYLAYCCR